LSRAYKCVVLFLVVLIISGCSMQRSNSRSHMSYSEPKTFEKDIEYKVRSSITALNLQANIKLKEGAIKYILTDPAGKIRWTKELQGKEEFQDNMKFDPIEGVWILNISCQDGAGDFYIEWTGK